MKVVVAIDQTAYASQVIDEILRRRWPPDTSFKVVTVVEPPQWQEVDWHKWQKLAEEVYGQLEEKALAVLKRTRSQLSENIPDSTVHIEVRRGIAKDELLKSTVEWMPDKVIVGAHGHSPNRLFGSVPRTLSREAPCSVELVRLKKIPSPIEHVTSTSKAAK